MFRHLILYIVLPLIWTNALVGSAQKMRKFRIAELNCENLFDTIHDEGFDDHEFLPASSHQWNTRRYRTKLSMIAREIAGVAHTAPLDLVALIEVENERVVNDLTRHTRLARMNYKYIVTHSNDPRGIDVALLYQEGGFRPLKTHMIDWALRLKKDVRTRQVLHVDGLLPSGDTLSVFVCHLPSRLGGRRSKLLRCQICQSLRQYVDSLIEARPTANVVILGDFNDSPSSRSVSRSLGAGRLMSSPACGPPAVDCRQLYNLAYSAIPLNHSSGTYRYRGRWEMLDQCVVNGRLAAPHSPLRLARQPLRIADLTFLLSRDKSFSGLCPWRTYQGNVYRGGFSDHLPLLLELEYCPSVR